MVRACLLQREKQGWLQVTNNYPGPFVNQVVPLLLRASTKTAACICCGRLLCLGILLMPFLPMSLRPLVLTFDTY